MGEYAREEIKRRGLKIAQVARNLGISRQSMDWRFSKDEWSMSEMNSLEEAVQDKSFFDRYFETTKAKRPATSVVGNMVGEPEQAGYVKKSAPNNLGYTISIEVDPENFNPQEWDRMSEAMKEMMKKLKK